MQLWNNFLWTDETKINFYQNNGKRRVRRREGTDQYPKHSSSSAKHGGGAIMSPASMAVNAAGSLLFIDDVTADKSIRMNSEFCFRPYYLLMFSQMLQNFLVQMDNDLKYSMKTTNEFVNVKKWNVLQRPSQSSDLNSESFRASEGF